MVELESYGIGVQYTTWTRIEPELHPGRGRNHSDRLCQGFDSRACAENHLKEHVADIQWKTSTKRKQRWTLQGGRCWYCGELMEFDTVGEPRSAEEEHQTPQSWARRGRRALGGVRVNDGVNVVLACRACNQDKGASDVREYRAVLADRRGGAYVLFHGEWQRMATVRLARRSDAWKQRAGDAAPSVTRASLERSLAWIEQEGRVELHFDRALALEVPPAVPDEWLDTLLAREQRPPRPAPSQ
nr:HNH endonuclease domain-containing protein [Deinococcus yavapaiensis]